MISVRSIIYFFILLPPSLDGGSYDNLTVSEAISCTLSDLGEPGTSKFRLIFF
jgi:hypothetical protein